VRANRVYDKGRQLLRAEDGSTVLMPVGDDIKTWKAAGHEEIFATDPASGEVEPPIVFDLTAEEQRRGCPHARVYDNDWKGQRCFILAGGPSLRGFDWTRLFGERVIAINRALEFYPEADVCFSLDPNFYSWTTEGQFGEHAKRTYKNYQGVKIQMKIDKTPFPAEVQRVRAYPNQNGLSPAMRYGLCAGGNSGAGALNLAICLGCSDIYLLGYDCKTDKGGMQKNFHSGYPRKQKSNVYRRFKATFNLLAPEAKKRARIINVNRDSGIKCFEFGDFPKYPLPIFASFYTPDYGDSAARLARSCDKFHLQYCIERMKDKGSWKENCDQKAKFIRQVRKRNPGAPVVWIDADAEVLEYPKLFHQLDPAVDVAYAKIGHQDEVLSGTVYFAPTDGATQLLLRWQKFIDQNKGEVDQVNLGLALKNWVGNSHWLPDEYCRIFDHPKQGSELPVIMQYQQSRSRFPRNKKKGPTGGANAN